MKRWWRMALCWGCCAAAAQAQTLVGPDYQRVAQLIGQGALAQAQEQAQAYLGSHAQDPQIRLLLSRIYSAQAQPEKAFATLVDLTRDYPEIAEPFNNLAVMYAEQGRLEDAREALLAALRNNPQYALAWRNLGDVYARMAQDAHARAAAAPLASAPASAPASVPAVPASR